MKIYDLNGVEIIDLVVSDDSYRYRAIMGENALTLTFSLPIFTEIPVGSYAEFQGETYTLLKPQNFKKNHSRDFEYSLILDSAKSLLGRYKLRDSSSRKLKFSNTAKPKEHLEMLVWNLNQRDSGWTVGDYVNSVEKVVSFNHTYCDAALKSIAEAFNTEYEIVGKVISIKKIEYNKSNPLPLSYGFGNGFKSGVKRDNYDNSKAIEILFVQGGDKNIDSTAYGFSELLLPKSQKLKYDGTYFEGETGFNSENYREYISDENGFSIKRYGKELATHIEDSLDLSDIYPSRVGTISAVVVANADKNFYDFIDSSIPDNLNFTSCLIEGEKMTVIFQSGILAGKEFDVSYNSGTKKFEIVPQAIDGVTMPNATFKPVVGDKYAVFGISLPDAYVCDNASKTGGSWDMFRESVKYMFENEDPRFSFTGDLDGVWSKKDWVNIGGKIVLGGYAAFSDEHFQTTPVLLRMVGIKDYINNPHSPQVELSNVTVGGNSLSSALGKIDQNEVVVEDSKKDVVNFAKRGFREVKETTEMLQKVFTNFSGSISPLSITTMQLIAGDERLQFEFVSDPTSTASVYHFEQYNKDSKRFISLAGVLQHKTLGITTVSSSHSANEFKSWNMSIFVSAVLDDPSKPYYVYARVSKNNTTGSFLLSEEALLLEWEDGYYHLFMGILNSEVDGDRSYSPLYGFTEVLPGRITTNKIVSNNGQTYFDLLGNKIKGYIEFMDGLIAGMIKLSSNGVVTAGLQGDSAVNVGAWFGGTYEDALAALAKIVLNKDGSFQFGGGSFRGDAAGNIITDMGFEATEGHVGGFSIFENSIMNDTVEFADEEVETLDQLLNPVVNKIIKTYTWHAATTGKNAMAYTQPLVLANSGSISFAVSATAGNPSGYANMTLRVLITDTINTVVFSDYTEASATGIIANKPYMVRLPSGTYNIQAIASHQNALSVDIIGEQIRNDDNTFSEYIRAIPSSNRNKLGNNGMFSFWNKSNYHYYSAPFGFKHKGSCCLVNTSYQAFVDASNPEPIISNINQFNSFILNINDSDRVLHLPAVSEFELGVNDMKISIITAYSNGGQLRIESKTGATLYDWDGNAKARILMSVGDSFELHAIRSGLDMKYFITKQTGGAID